MFDSRQVADVRAESDFRAQACADIINNVWAHGCYSRKQNGRHWAQSSSVSGGPRDVPRIAHLRAGHGYNNSTEIRSWRPTSGQVVPSSCRTKLSGLPTKGFPSI